MDEGPTPGGGLSRVGQVDLYRLEPRSPFHFGERGVGLEETGDVFHSDALFSALCVSLREGWGTAAVERLLQAFQQSAGPPFRLSSCYPYAGDALFFPRPMLSAPLGSEVIAEAAKALKHVRFVSREIFEPWLRGEELSNEVHAENFLLDNQLWVTNAELERLERSSAEIRAGLMWTRTDVPRVTVDRETSASAIWRCGRLVFGPGCGLYFLVRWEDEAWREPLEQALWLLSDAGLGGRRSSGYGQFTPQPAQRIDLLESIDAPSVLTLSHYWPTAQEIEDGVLGEHARYELSNRQGWMGSPSARALRRRQVRMVAAGSVLTSVPGPLGGLADVTPDGFEAHRVYRYGFAFPIPVSSSAGQEEVASG